MTARRDQTAAGRAGLGGAVELSGSEPGGEQILVMELLEPKLEPKLESLSSPATQVQDIPPSAETLSSVIADDPFQSRPVLWLCRPPGAPS